MGLTHPNLRFLVADDSPLARTIVETLLKKLGATKIFQAEDGQAALLKARQMQAEGTPFDIIILDWEMPVMNGLEALKVIRVDPLLKDSIVIMATSLASPENLKQIAKYRPDSYIIKPTQLEALEARINSLSPKLKKAQSQG